MNCSHDIEYNIKSINFVNDESPTQAYFESVQSNQNKHFFKFYIKSAFRNFINLSQGNFTQMNEKNLWLHELVHSLDFQQIKIAHRDIYALHNKMFRKSVSNADLLDMIQMLDQLRFVGIATLVEAIYQNEHRTHSELLELIVSNEIINKIIDSTINKADKYAHYVFGKYMVLKILFYLNMVENKVIADFWLGTLQSKQLLFNKLLADENLIENLFKIKLKDFIVANFMPHVNIFPFDISQIFINNLTEHLGKYQGNNFENEYSMFLIDLANQ